MKVVLQKSLNDCGLACVAMLAEHYGKAVDYDALLSVAPARMWDQGLSMRKLCEIAAGLGLGTQAYRCPSHTIHKLGQPSIAHCRGDHYMVVQRCSSRGVEVIDPRYGRIALSRDEFAETYSGICLTAEPEKGAPQAGLIVVRQTGKSAWRQEMKASFLGWARALLALAGLHLAIVAVALLSISLFLPRPGAALFLSLAAVLWVEGLVLSRLLEPLLLRSYSRTVRKIATLCSPFQGHMVEVPGGYRLIERMRWMAEQIYSSRDSFLELARFVTGLLALLAYCLVVKDLWLGAAAVAFGATAATTGWRGVCHLPLSEEEHAERRFTDALLQQFIKGASEGLPWLRARGLGPILNQKLAFLVGSTAFVAYWLLVPRSHTVTEFLILGVSQLKLLEWWKASVPAAASGRIIHHCYQHLDCMHIAAQAAPARILTSTREGEA
jgi:hypothetical protein